MTIQRPFLLAANLLNAVNEDLHSLSLHDLVQLDRATSHITSIVRARVNTYAPMNTLPDELLARIFEYALPWRSSGTHSRGYQKASHRSDMLARMPLTHVCRRWRFAAIATAALWTTIDEDVKYLQDIFLDRSGGATFQALVRYTADGTTGVHIAPHAERLNDLFVVCPSASEETGIRTELPFGVPNLQCLSMCSSGTIGRDRINLEALDTIFPHGAPSLTRLVLWHMRRIPDLPYKQLTHLYIGHGKRLPIIDLLRHCSALQDLALIDAAITDLPPIPSEDENSEVQLELPHLRVLTLGTYKSPIAAVYLPRLLPALVLPSGLTLRVVGSQATALLDLDEFNLHRMPIMSTLTAMTVDLRADGRCTLRATGPSASVLLDLPDFRAQRRHGLRRKQCFIPLSAVEVVTYRTELRNTDLDMLLNCDLPSHRLLRFVDAYVPPRDPTDHMQHVPYRFQGGPDCDDYIEALSWVLEDSPRLVEMEIWSANAEFPGKVWFDGVPLRKVTFHYTGGDDQIMEEVDLTPLRNRVPEVIVCTSPCGPEPSTTIPENEALQWEDSGETY